MKMSILILLSASLLAGCATRQSVEADGVGNSFSSKLGRSELARCMVRNIDGKILGSLKGSIESAEDRVDVIVRNGDHIWAVAKIAANATGSTADILYGAAGKVDIEVSRKWMTDGCS